MYVQHGGASLTPLHLLGLLGLLIIRRDLRWQLQIAALSNRNNDKIITEIYFVVQN